MIPIELAVKQVDNFGNKYNEREINQLISLNIIT